MTLEKQDNQEKIIYEVFLYPFTVPENLKYLEIEDGEKFTIPENFEYGVGYIFEKHDFYYKFERGITYSIHDGEVVKYLPEGVERYKYFIVPLDNSDDFIWPYARFSLEKYISNNEQGIVSYSSECKWGYATSSPHHLYEELIPAEYDDATDINHKMIGAVQNDSKWFFLNVYGGKIDDQFYDDVCGPYLDTGFFSFAKKEWGSGRGLIDSFGRVVFMPHYDTMPIPLPDKTFHIYKNGQSGLINRMGEILVPIGEYKHSESINAKE